LATSGVRALNGPRREVALARDDAGAAG